MGSCRWLRLGHESGAGEWGAPSFRRVPAQSHGARRPSDQVTVTTGILVYVCRCHCARWTMRSRCSTPAPWLYRCGAPGTALSAATSNRHCNHADDAQALPASCELVQSGAPPPRRSTAALAPLRTARRHRQRVWPSHVLEFQVFEALTVFQLRCGASAAEPRDDIHARRISCRRSSNCSLHRSNIRELSL